ncbi:hypothetical protein D1007_38473 [Hordeum vulgare]|nr:hypothetical protein D1007_38473 [Hordeum vulgare]
MVPLQAHSTPLWGYQIGDDKLRLRSPNLPTEELNRVVATLLGGDPGDLPEALVPLYRLNDRANLICVLRVFDERGSSRPRALARLRCTGCPSMADRSWTRRLHPGTLSPPFPTSRYPTPPSFMASLAHL